MKIAITATGDNLPASVDPRFGRAQYFIILNPDTMEFEAISNTELNAAHGAGIQAGQLMSAKNVEVVITGNVGPNAQQTLTAAGIQIFHAGNVSVAQAVEDFKAGKLQQIVQSGPAHAGMGGGMGRGRGYGYQTPGTANPAPAATMSREQEIKDLKAQAANLAQQLDAITKRINELEKSKNQ